MLWSDRLWLFTLGRLGHCLRAFTRVHACACVPVLPLCVRVVCSVCELLGSVCQSVPRAVGTWRRARWTAHGGAAACKICCYCFDKCKNCFLLFHSFIHGACPIPFVGKTAREIIAPCEPSQSSRICTCPCRLHRQIAAAPVSKKKTCVSEA